MAIEALARVVAPVPPFAMGSVPVTPVVNGSPVTLVITPDAGVPRATADKVGLTKVLFVSVSTPVRVANVLFMAGTVRSKVDAVFVPFRLI